MVVVIALSPLPFIFYWSGTHGDTTTKVIVEYGSLILNTACGDAASLKAVQLSTVIGGHWAASCLKIVLWEEGHWGFGQL